MVAVQSILTKSTAMDIDWTARHAGYRFNEKIPCNCGLDYCSGLVSRRTELRHRIATGATQDLEPDALDEARDTSEYHSQYFNI